MRILLTVPKTTVQHPIGKRVAMPIGLFRLREAANKIKIDLGNTGTAERDWRTQQEHENQHEITVLDIPAEGFDNEQRQTIGGFDFTNFGLDDKEVLRKILNERSELIGINSQFTSQFHNLLDLMQLIKNPSRRKNLFDENELTAEEKQYLEKLHEIPVVVGGINATYFTTSQDPKERENLKKMLFENGADFIVKGPGDLAFARLVTALSELQGNELENYLKKIPGLRFLKPEIRKKQINERKIEKGDFTENMGFERIHDINEHPMIDYAAINKSLYTRERFHAGIAKTPYFVDFFSSEGCDLKCDYCTSWMMWGKYREMSDERVKAELQKIKKAGFTEICVHDDSIFTHPTRAKRLFRMIKETGFDNFTCIGGIEMKQLMCKLENKEGVGTLFNRPVKDEIGRRTSQEDIVEIEFEKIVAVKERVDKNKGVFNSQIEQEIQALGLSSQDEAKVRNFLSDPKTRIREVCDGQSLLKSLEENGCYRIYLAVESGIKETLDAVGKERNLPKEKSYSESEVAQMLKNYNIEAHPGMMFGHPETEGIAEIVQNVRFAKMLKENGMTRPSFFIYKMLPGTQLTNVALQHGAARIREDLSTVGYYLTMGNHDSIKYKWAAEELTAFFTWANETLGSKLWTDTQGLTNGADEVFENQVKNLFADEEQKQVNQKELYRFTIKYLYKALGEHMPIEQQITRYENALQFLGREIPIEKEKIKKEALSEAQMEIMKEKAEGNEERITEQVFPDDYDLLSEMGYTEENTEQQEVKEVKQELKSEFKIR